MAKLLERAVLWTTGREWFQRWLAWMEERGSVRFIRRLESGSPEPYLDRFYLLKLPFFSLYLHRFWSSDEEGVHCHPWPNASLVLAGGYFEQWHDGTSEWRGPGSFRYRQSRVMHRLTVAEGDEGWVWSLFAHGRRERQWGFMRGVSWVAARDAEKPASVRGFVFPRIGARVDDASNP